MPRWKRTIDIIFSLAALPVLAVATLVMTVIVAIVSPGSVLFRQVRVGYRGRQFRIYKFRTMMQGADTVAHQAYLTQLIASGATMTKLDARRDTRLIPGAWFLRATGIDELPQLLNVLRGEMSLIGPRPCIPYEYEQYTPAQQMRFEAVPGLTGLWQISGKNRTTFEEMIRLDVEYARNLSLRRDLSILARTIPALVQQVGDTRRSRRRTRREKERMAVPSCIEPKNVLERNPS